MADFSPIDPSQRDAGQLQPPTPPSPAPSGFPAWNAPSATPPGYVRYGSAPTHVQPPTKLRKAVVAVNWLEAAAALAFGIIAYSRGGIVDDFVNGDGAFSDLEAADTRVGVVALVVIALGLTSTILTCLWSYRTVKNAKVRDPRCDASPGLACGGWWIPIGNIWVSWQQLRRAVRHYRGAVGALNLWQGLTLGSAALIAIARFMVAGTVDLNEDAVVSRFRTQGVMLLIAAAISIGIAVVSMKATSEVDEATSGSGQAAVR